MPRKNKTDIWDVIFYAVIILSIISIVYKPRIDSNVVQGRELFDLDSSDDVESHRTFEDTTAENQQTLGYLDLGYTFAQFVVGGYVIVKILDFLHKKARR